VPVKTRVVMVREPVKVGLRQGRVHVEVHDDPDAKVDVRKQATVLLSRRGVAALVDKRKLETVLQERRGIPVDVSLEAF
jgi:L,D-transpeptidase ErfK/SrfK